MKTNLFKKANETQKNEFIEMNKDELKSIQGGQYYLIQMPDGTYQIRICVL